MQHDWIGTSSDAPQEVNYYDPTWTNDINKFYQALRANLHDSWLDWLLFIEDLLLGNKFFYKKGKYYLLPHMHKPYIVKKYETAPMPGQPGF
jgi:hypothetical protein